MEAVFELKGVNKIYHKFELGPINLSIPKGFATALIGANGAGKTTLLNLIAGVSLRKEGVITYWDHGNDVDQNKIREEIGYTASSIYYPENWNVKHVAHSLSLAYEGFHPEQFDALCREFSLDQVNDRKKRPMKKLSSGSQMRVMLASVLARDTSVLVLDEPASPLDPVMRDELCDKFREYLAQGNGEKSILFSTHNIADMELVTDYAVFMERGKVIEAGFVEDLKEKYLIVRGDGMQLEEAKSSLLYCSKPKMGFEGLAESKERGRLERMDLVLERPTLQQLSVLLLRKAKEVL